MSKPDTPGFSVPILYPHMSALKRFENIQRKSLSHSVTPSLMLSSTVCITSRVRSTSSRARSAASLAAASASSRSLSEVTSRPNASSPPSLSGRKLNST